jgi:predicted component of type VI protein secretion system
MKVKLVAVRPRSAKRTIVLDELPVVVGRDPDAHISLDDSWVSRQHCEIDENEGALVIRDLRSRNGTFVNGRRVQEEELAPGDRLTIGIASFQVQYRRTRVRPSLANGSSEAANPQGPRRAFSFLRRFGARNGNGQRVSDVDSTAAASAAAEEVATEAVEEAPEKAQARL